MNDENLISQAKKYAHLAALIPVWGIVVAFTCYAFIDKKRPEECREVFEAIIWQMLLAIIHFAALASVMIVFVVFPSDITLPVTITGVSVFIIWLCMYVFGIITSIAAAKSSITRVPFRYPFISTFLAPRTRFLTRPPGSDFYPFQG